MARCRIISNRIEVNSQVPTFYTIVIAGTVILISEPTMAVENLFAYAAALGVASLIYSLVKSWRFNAKYKYPTFLPGNLPFVGHLFSMPKLDPGEMRVWFSERATEHGEM